MTSTKRIQTRVTYRRKGQTSRVQLVKFNAHQFRSLESWEIIVLTLFQMLIMTLLALGLSMEVIRNCM